jgi:hypothetical protein
MRISFHYAQTYDNLKQGTLNIEEILNPRDKAQPSLFSSNSLQSSEQWRALPNPSEKKPNQAELLFPEQSKIEEIASSKEQLQSEKVPRIHIQNEILHLLLLEDKLNEPPQEQPAIRQMSSQPEQPVILQTPTQVEQALIPKKPGQQIKNELLYHLLSDNLINLNTSDRLKWTISMLDALAAICEAQGDRASAMFNLIKADVPEHINQPLIYLFQNRQGGMREVKLNRTGAKLFQVLRLLRDIFPGTTKQKHLKLNNKLLTDKATELLANVFRQLDSKTNFRLRGYIRHVNVTIKDDLLTIQLGKPLGSMGALYKIELPVI